MHAAKALIYQLAAGFALKCKYKGASNRNTQIRGTFSQSGQQLICGSDDGWVYVWDTYARRVRMLFALMHARTHARRLHVL